MSSVANPCLSVNVALTLLSCPPQLIQSPVTTPLGLIMLKTTSEELACPREDLSVARKEELRKLLLDQVQTVLGLLTGTSHTVPPRATDSSVSPSPPTGAAGLALLGSGKPNEGDAVAAAALGTLSSALECVGQLNMNQPVQQSSCWAPSMKRGRGWLWAH